MSSRPHPGKKGVTGQAGNLNVHLASHACHGRPQVAVAEQLYDVLVHPTVNRRRLPVLLAANKGDCGPRSHTADFIRKRLEKALGELRGSRAALASDETGAGGKVRGGN